MFHMQLSGKGPAPGHAEVSGGLCACHCLPAARWPPIASLPQAEPSVAAFGIREEETDRSSRDLKFMLVLNWERNISCRPWPQGTEKPSGQCPGQWLDNPTDTVYTWLFASRQIMFISLPDYERHTGMPVS
jgi:hypothetical protein